MSSPITSRLSKSLHTFLETDPTPGWSFLLLRMEADSLVLQLDTNAQYVDYHSYAESCPPLRFRGVAAATIPRMLNGQTSQALETALLPGTEQLTSWILAESDVVKLTIRLQRQSRLHRILPKSVSVAEMHPVVTPAQVLAWAHETVTSLNQDCAAEVDCRIAWLTRHNPSQAVEWHAVGQVNDELRFDDKVVVTLLQLNHRTPLQVVGLWVDLRNPDPLAPLRVAVACNDTRLAGSQHRPDRVRYYTNQVGLTQGIEHLWIAPAYREWALSCGKPWAHNESIRFVEVADILAA
jgi:hypothetical protein